MNREEIIRMAAKSGVALYGMELNKEQFLNCLERFASLVAKQEREKCAVACEETSSDMNPMAHWAANECARMIRARGDKHD